MAEPYEPSWQDHANCVGCDPDLFFPARGASTREAKAVCAGCVVKAQCLEYALANGEKWGIWGGTSERERRRIRKQRRQAPAHLRGRVAAAVEATIRAEPRRWLAVLGRTCATFDTAEDAARWWLGRHQGIDLLTAEALVGPRLIDLEPAS